MTQLKKVDFSLIRYANCWEDVEVLLEGLNAESGGRHLSIASAGDNSFSLLMTDPDLVVAVDVNEVQLHLVELKKAAIRRFNRATFLEFAGFRGSKIRLNLFEILKNDLPENTRIYWENHRNIIQNGIIYAGKLEKYFGFFHRCILPLVHSKKTILEFLSPKSDEEQAEFYSRKWNTPRWRFLFKLFFNRYILGKYGRDPEFLKQVDCGVSNYFLNQVGEHFQKQIATRNYMLDFILLGKFKNHLPHYVRKDNYEIIQKRLDRLVTFQGFAENAISEFGQFDYFNLSNIFEYMDSQTFKNTVDKLKKGASENAKFAYWNLMVPRVIGQDLDSNFKSDDYQMDFLNWKDKGLFYSQFILEVFDNQLVRV